MELRKDTSVNFWIKLKLTEEAVLEMNTGSAGHVSGVVDLRDEDVLDIYIGGDLVSCLNGSQDEVSREIVVAKGASSLNGGGDLGVRECIVLELHRRDRHSK
jgi:hypothetical protein